MLVMKLSMFRLKLISIDTGTRPEGGDFLFLSNNAPNYSFSKSSFQPPPRSPDTH